MERGKINTLTLVHTPVRLQTKRQQRQCGELKATYPSSLTPLSYLYPPPPVPQRGKFHPLLLPFTAGINRYVELYLKGVFGGCFHEFLRLLK